MSSKKNFNSIFYRRTKKGDISYMMTFGLLVLGAIIILVTTAWLIHFYFTVKDKMEVQSCKNSISAHALLAESTKGEVFTDIKCPTRNIPVDTKYEEQTKEALAEDMHRCWYEWNEGNGKYFKGDGIFCHVCSIYTFKPSDKNINGFVTYLTSHKIKKKYASDNPELTYAKYFKIDTQGADSAIIQKIPENFGNYDYINTTLPYSSVFIYISSKASLEKFLEGRGTAFTVAGGTTMAIGAAGAGAGISAAAAGGTALLGIPVVGWVAGGIILLGAGAATVYFVYIVKDVDSPYYPFIFLIPYSSQNLKQIGCEHLDVMQLTNQPQAAK